jgi:hypothetical protein
VQRFSKKRALRPCPWKKLIAGSAAMHSSTLGSGYDVAVSTLNKRKARRDKSTQQRSAETALVPAILVLGFSISIDIGRERCCAEPGLCISNMI